MRVAVRGVGTLNLLAIPAADVFLRGQPLGRTPLMGHELPAGRHRLTLRATGVEKTITVRIRPGRRTVQSVSLAGDR